MDNNHNKPNRRLSHASGADDRKLNKDTRSSAVFHMERSNDGVLYIQLGAAIPLSEMKTSVGRIAQRAWPIILWAAVTLVTGVVQSHSDFPPPPPSQEGNKQ